MQCQICTHHDAVVLAIHAESVDNLRKEQKRKIKLKKVNKNNNQKVQYTMHT